MREGGKGRRLRTTKAPAKLNFRLKVAGRRPDGYHDLVSIMVPIDVFDLLTLEVIPEGVSLSCRGLPVRSDEANLVVKAARAFFSKTGFDQGCPYSLRSEFLWRRGWGVAAAMRPLLCCS
jgi:4-diphosphocytidyl-2C-methyl-D-erythritol kinase